MTSPSSPSSLCQQWGKWSVLRRSKEGEGREEGRNQKKQENQMELPEVWLYERYVDFPWLKKLAQLELSHPEKLHQLLVRAKASFKRKQKKIWRFFLPTQKESPFFALNGVGVGAMCEEEEEERSSSFGSGRRLQATSLFLPHFLRWFLGKKKKKRWLWDFFFSSH